jgi:predicted lipoprotein with Yx(FWY)xxD motif
MSTRVAVVAALLPALMAGCADDPVAPAAESTATSSSPAADNTDRAAPGPSTSPSVEPTKPGTKIIAATSDFGAVLFDATGQAIYLFDVEESSKPRCYKDCAKAWPPVLTDGAPEAGQRVKASLLGTTERTDGTTQVTYGGHPLYFYAHEGKREVKCHDIFLNGGTWYAIQPDGQPAP